MTNYQTELRAYRIKIATGILFLLIGGTVGMVAGGTLVSLLIGLGIGVASAFLVALIVSFLTVDFIRDVAVHIGTELLLTLEDFIEFIRPPLKPREFKTE